jgi:DNA invertase Pin-like site-specific DNA recombinase
MAGLEAASACGRKGGRKPVRDDEKLALASAMLKNRDIPVREVCEAVGVSRSTLYRHLKPDGNKAEGPSASFNTEIQRQPGSRQERSWWRRLFGG